MLSNQMLDMGRDIALTFVSILAGIATSFAFFVLSTRKARRAGWRLAKSRITADLAQSLGQDRVPPPEAIVATIRSILREHDVTELQGVTYGEVMEELLRQVTADPFLDSERRTALQLSLINLQRLPGRVSDGAEAGSKSSAEYDDRTDAELSPATPAASAQGIPLDRAGRINQFLATASKLRWYTLIIGIVLGLIVTSAIGSGALGLNIFGIIDLLLEAFERVSRR